MASGLVSTAAEGPGCSAVWETGGVCAGFPAAGAGRDSSPPPANSGEPAANMARQKARAVKALKFIFIFISPKRIVHENGAAIIKTLFFISAPPFPSLYQREFTGRIFL
jgi:hypothetical protein